MRLEDIYKKYGMMETSPVLVLMEQSMERIINKEALSVSTYDRY